jgi:hypothetical protein
LRVHEQDLAVLVHRCPGVGRTAFPRVDQEREGSVAARQQLCGHVAQGLVDFLAGDGGVFARDDRAQ